MVLVIIVCFLMLMLSLYRVFFVELVMCLGKVGKMCLLVFMMVIFSFVVDMFGML